MPSPDMPADSFRRWGFLQADLDRLGRLPPLPHQELDAARGPDADRLRAIYCGPIGAEFMHIRHADRSGWVARRMEEAAPGSDQRQILARLARAELFEHFLHARYVGTKRYSLEGSASLVTAVDAVLDAASAQGVEVALIAMSHRGRLTIMLLNVNVPAANLFAGFQDVEPRTALGGGDVKYHQGATGDFTTASGRTVHIHMVSNPSHLEAVNPVVAGRVRARQERIGEQGRRQVLGITIHGDAAFAGQGIAAETLNFAGLKGFDIGGTVHLIVNNLIGFTAEPAALYSSRFASDVARRLAIPILHVNGEEPEAVDRAARIATDYRAQFGSDVVVDLIGFRRYGHSEVDDPTATQPLLYRAIEGRELLYRHYGKRIGMPERELASLEEEITQELSARQEEGRSMTKKPVLRKLPAYWDRYRGGRWGAELEVETAVHRDQLERIAARLVAVPEGLAVHPKVKKLLEQRLEMGSGKRPVDWAMAEALALGTLVWDGVPVRLAGQDSRRGTFNQRHAALIDQRTGAAHLPLCHLREGQAHCDILDTALSEAAAMGFEYGYSRDYPDALVCWEAQFGDFVNGGQVIIDQFLSAAEDKWDLLSGLVLLLPHGYEGQGPEHSSARLERFLQLCAEDNMQICQPTTAAQYFHLLRRQALRVWRKPLVVMTPKGMLRLGAAASPLTGLCEGRFMPVLPDPEIDDARRVLICTGKIAHELRAERVKRGVEATAIVTLEQIHPFPLAEMEEALAAHPQAKDLIWVQEEPANMGSLTFVRPLLARAGSGRPVTSVKRAASASPSTGSSSAHALEQAALMDLAFAGRV